MAFLQDLNAGAKILQFFHQYLIFLFCSLSNISILATKRWKNDDNWRIYICQSAKILGGHNYDDNDDDYDNYEDYDDDDDDDDEELLVGY